jgi:hypothetical protein
MNLITLLLLTSFPLIFVALVSAFFWKRLERKTLFLVACALAFFFIGDIGYQIISGILVPPLPDPVPNSLALSKTMASTSILSMALADGLVVILGIPFSRWLFTALRKKNQTIAT